MGHLEGSAKPDFAPIAVGRTNFCARFCVVLFASILGFTCVLSAAAIAAGSDKEYRVKAAFVLNFASLTEWPSESFGDSKAPIVICHVGGEQTKSLLDAAYSGRRIERRSLELRHLSSSGMLSGCHIVFITQERDEQDREFITAVAGKSILTIGETEGFARSGGVIGFYSDGSKIRFEVNLGAAERARLHISSRLLKLARLVSSEGE
jgi:hypothetical protein